MKKIISLFLVALLLFSFQVVSIADDEETYADIEFAKAFGFISPEADIYPEDVLTRMELAEIFFNIVYDSNVIFTKEYQNVEFSDVPEDKKHIVSTVYSLGVMRGYSDTVFAPDDPVTYSQLIKTFVAFLGYDVLAQYRGGYPTGYLAVAAQLGLLPTYTINGDSVATYAAATGLLKKASVVDIGELTAEGGYIVKKGVSYLEYYKEAKVGKGTVTGNYLTNIYDDQQTNFFSVFIDGEPMQVAYTAAGIQNCLGYEVYVYYEVEGNTKTVIYYEEALNDVIDIKSGDIDYVSSSSVRYYEGLEIASADLISNATVIFNGSYLDSYSAADLNPYTAEKLDGTLRLIDKNFDGVYDTVVVTAFKTYVVSDVVNKKIYNEYVPGAVVDISNYKERNIDIVNVIGEPIEPETIKAGNIVNVCYDRNNQIKKIIVSKDSIVGKVDEVTRVGANVSALKISGTTFDAATGVTILDTNNRLRAGATVKIFLNCENKIAYIDVDSEYVDGYTRGLLVDTAVGSGLEGGVTIRLFETDGAMHDYTLPKKVYLNDVSVESATLESEVFGLDTDGEVRRQVILFKTDEAETSVIKKIIVADTSGVPTDGFYQFLNSTGGTTFNYQGGMRTFSGSFGYDANTTLVLSMPALDKRHNYNEYEVSSMGTTEGSSKSNLNALIYGTAKDGLLADTVVIDNSDVTVTVTDPDKRPTMLIEKVTEVYDAENDQTLIKVSGPYIEGTTAYNGGFTCKREDLMAICGGKLPDVGDVYRWQYFRTTGTIKQFNATYDFIIFDRDEQVLCNGENPKKYPDTCEFNYGKVVEKNGPMIKVELYNANKDKKVYMLNAGYYKFLEYYQPKNGDVKFKINTDYSSILAETTNPENPSEVIVFHRASGIGVFIFNKEV